MDTPAVQPLPPPVTPPVPPPPPPKKYSGILIGILLLAIAILVGMELDETTFISNVRLYLGAKPTPAPTSFPTPSPAPDPTADWKTYTNTQYGFQFKYPTNWTLNDLTEGQQVEIYYQPDRTKSVGSILIEKLQRAPGDIAQYTTKKQIGDLTADCISDPTGIKEWCYISDHILSIFITKDQNLTYNEIVAQILSTFKFVNQTPTPTCRPRPACLDATPRCLIPETADMCPKASPAPSTTYTCPPSGWVDCMPGPDAKPECSATAMEWYRAHCPDFKGGAL